jgi:SulP family sulfate permease
VISVIGLLLNVSGLQLARREDFDLNQELRAAGLAQLAAGLLGNMPGYHTLSLSALVDRMGAHTRLATIAATTVGGVVFFLGADIVALMPRVVLGAIIVFLGLGFLSEWLYDAWFQLPRLDYALIVVILALIAMFGMLVGVVAGLAIAVALFVVAYSRIDVVKHTLSGTTLKSRMTRGYAEQQLLRERGEQIAIFQLQGFIFFGTAHDLYERVRQRATRPDLPALRFVLLDFRLVPRLDSTAMLSFAKMLQLAEARDLALVFTQLAPAVRRQIEQGLPRDDASRSMRIFPDLDRGLEWCENELLAAADTPGGGEQSLRSQLAQIAPDPDALLAYFERRVVGPGEYLLRQGEHPEDMFFVESGQVTAQIEPEGGPPLRLETMRGGRAVGELGFFLNRRRTAAVVADETSAVYRITWPDLRRMAQEQPDSAAAFHGLIARLLSERVVHLIDSVDALQR